MWKDQANPCDPQVENHWPGERQQKDGWFEAVQDGWWGVRQTLASQQGKMREGWNSLRL